MVFRTLTNPKRESSRVEAQNPYHVAFRVYRERKKYRLHVMSAYPAPEGCGSGKIGFFKITYNLRMGKPLLSNPQK